MAEPTASQGGIGSTAFKGLLLIVLGCGLESCFPTVKVSCPARTASAPDCELRSSIAFDRVAIRHAPLPALQPIGEVEWTRPARGKGSPALYFDTAAGRVSAIRWGDQMSLQKDLQEPLRAYFADPHAPATEATMRPTLWTDPGGDAPNRLVRKTHPGKIAANVLVIGGLLFWIWLPIQLVTSLRPGSRA